MWAREPRPRGQQGTTATRMGLRITRTLRASFARRRRRSLMWQVRAIPRHARGGANTRVQHSPASVHPTALATPRVRTHTTRPCIRRYFAATVHAQLTAAVPSAHRSEPAGLVRAPAAAPEPRLAAAVGAEVSCALYPSLGWVGGASPRATTRRTPTTCSPRVRDVLVAAVRAHTHRRLTSDRPHNTNVAVAAPRRCCHAQERGQGLCHRRDTAQVWLPSHAGDEPALGQAVGQGA